MCCPKKGIHVVIAALSLNSQIAGSYSHLCSLQDETRCFMHSSVSAVLEKESSPSGIDNASKASDYIVRTCLGCPQHKRVKNYCTTVYACDVCRKNHIYYIFINMLQFWRFWYCYLSGWL